MNQLLPKGIWTALLAVGVLTLGHARPGEAVSGQSGKKSRSNKTVEELCQPSRAQTDLDLNNVRTTIMGGGDMWWDLNVARYEIPKGSNRHSMFAGALWLGGLDEGGQLKLAAMTYRSRGNDFWPGPLSTDGLASVNKDICDKYDRHWIIYREQVELHRAWLLCKNDPDCNPGEKFPGYEGSIPEIILEWPAHGVDGDLPYTLAPFIDLDGDNRYDPLEDYPAYDFDRAFDCRKKETDVLYGDMTLWWVYNDRGNVHTETSAGALGFEIRAQAFAFSTNDEINNMTFNNYRILNKSTFRLTNTYFSTWFDPDLGNYTDDIIGCDIPRGLGYVYNADNNDEGPIGYGFNPPSVAMDFFQGPFADYFDGKDNDRDGCVDGIRDANGVCQPENPVTGLNERIIMSGFMYYNAGNAATGDPRNASEFYNYMQSRWRNGNPLVVENPSGPGNTSNGDGFTQDGTGLATKFAYPGNTFDTTLQNDPKAPQNWFESPDNKQDKRGLHNAGPFSLAPGALNFITTGVVWEREYNKQGLFASVEKVIIADDKAQALFDNCFQILNGPDAPDLTLQELDRELIIMMSYREGSNNQALDYEEVDPLIRNADNKYRFEGFQVFQLASKNASIGDRYDPSQAKLVAQCDIKNGVARMVNWELDPDLDLVVPQDMTLKSENGGIKLSFKLSEDAFATGQDRRFVNHKEYYFTVVAYAHNEYAPYDPSTGADGQRRPFLAGRNNVKRYVGIPHKIDSEAGGTVINTLYGFKPPVTRIEGIGNGGGVLRLDPASETEILSTVFANGYMPNPKYLGGYGPINVKVVDPLNVPEGEYYLIFDGVGGNARWSIQDKATGEVIANSLTSIKVLNEQIVPELGMSVEISDVEAPGLDEDGVRNGGLLTSDLVYSDPTKTWYKGIADDDSYSPYNWILAGPNDNATAAPAKFYKDIPNDPKGFFETILGGSWAPFYYVSSLGRGTAEGNTIYGMGPADSAMQVSLRLEPKNLQSVDVVFSKDPSKWTRVPVFEMGEDEALTQGGAPKFTLRRAAGLDKSNGQLVPGATTGWSYFPGYAINVETGTRLNMAFGENSWMLSDNGGDMKFNPTSRERIFPQDPVTGGFRFGGQHYIYVFAPSVRKGTTIVDLSYKGDDPTAHPLYSEITNLNTGTNRQTFTRSIMWCSLGMIQPQYQGVDLYTNMPSELRVRIRTARPYEKLVVDNTNTGNPKYLFSTVGIATGKGVNAVAKSALDNIRVVPNPYLSQSAYEGSQLDNLVKITNLPENCVVSVYTTDGSLVRTLRKDNTDTWMYWDLKNNYGVPIASGVYILHIQADGIGEKIIKWFGTMRPFDPTGF
jgi:hypothetical protein